MSSEIERAQALARENRTLCDLITLRRQLALVDRTLRTAIERPYQVEGVLTLAEAFRFAHGLLSQSGLVPHVSEPPSPYRFLLPSPAPTKGTSPMSMPSAASWQPVVTPPEEQEETLGGPKGPRVTRRAVVRKGTCEQSGGRHVTYVLRVDGLLGIGGFDVTIAGAEYHLRLDLVRSIAADVLARVSPLGRTDKMSKRPRPELPKELYLSLQTGEIAKVPSFEGWTTGDVQQWKSEHQRYAPAAEALEARPGPQVSPPKAVAASHRSENYLVRLARTLGIANAADLLDEDRLLRRFGEDRALYQAVHKRLVETQKERHPDVGIASLQRAMHSLLANPLFGGDIS